MAIYIVYGRPRYGKTYWVVGRNISYWLKEARKTGFKIYSNVWIKLENIKWLRKYYKKPEDCLGDIYKPKDLKNPKKLLFYWRDLDSWNYMSHGTIICDEAQRYFNARRWQLLTEETEMKITQHGKDDLDVYAITQHYSRIDPVLRLICEKFFKIERLWGWGNRTFRAEMSEYFLEELERIERDPRALMQKVTDENGNETEIDPVYREDFFILPALRLRKALYDTKQPVLPGRPMLLKHIERFCAHKGCPLHKHPKVMHI